MKTILNKNLWLALFAAFILAAGAALFACGTTTSSTTTTTTDDDASPSDDDGSPGADDDDDNDDDDNDDAADCPPITQQQATRFYWPNEPPFLGGEVIVEATTQQGIRFIIVGGILGMHGAKIDEAEWILENGDTLKPGSYDLTVKNGGTIKDGNPNMYVSMVYGATLSGTYDEMWVSVSGCAELDQTGWVGAKFTGKLHNVVFRKMTDINTGAIDWTTPAMGFAAEWDITNAGIIQAP